MKFDSIELAIEDIRNGKCIIVVDNEDKARELCELRSQIQKNKSQNKKIKCVENDFTFGDSSSSKELVEVVLKSDTRGSTEAIVSQL